MTRKNAKTPMTGGSHDKNIEAAVQFVDSVNFRCSVTLGSGRGRTVVDNFDRL